MTTSGRKLTMIHDLLLLVFKALILGLPGVLLPNSKQEESRPKAWTLYTSNN
jgi:hypothetical protein